MPSDAFVSGGDTGGPAVFKHILRQVSTSVDFSAKINKFRWHGADCIPISDLAVPRLEEAVGTKPRSPTRLDIRPVPYPTSAVTSPSSTVAPPAPAVYSISIPHTPFEHKTAVMLSPSSYHSPTTKVASSSQAELSPQRRAVDAGLSLAGGQLEGDEDGVLTREPSLQGSTVTFPPAYEDLR